LDEGSDRAPAIVAALCGTLILSTGGLATFPAVLPVLQKDWQLSNTAAGWITGSYHGGYMIFVPFLAALGDRVDARKILIASTAAAAVASLAFALLADGLWAALACQIGAGAALAGVYMPGLKGLADRVSGPSQGRYISFYTASFTVGTSLSFVVAGVAARAWGWRMAFAAAAAEQALAMLVVLAVVPAAPASSDRHRRPLQVPGGAAWRVLRDRFGPVLQSRATMAYIWGYAVHMWELFALRAWLVPFLAFSLARQPEGTNWNAPAVAALVTILGVPASIAGQEAASRMGPRRFIPLTMLAAFGLSLVVGWLSSLPFLVVIVAVSLYSIAISADSAPLTAAAIAAAPQGYRGSTMAVHSTVGFTSAMLGTLAVGATLDALGGNTAAAWGAAFAVMGSLGSIGALRLRP
jgi:MFS family permease